MSRHNTIPLFAVALLLLFHCGTTQLQQGNLFPNGIQLGSSDIENCTSAAYGVIRFDSQLSELQVCTNQDRWLRISTTEVTSVAATEVLHQILQELVTLRQFVQDKIEPVIQLEGDLNATIPQYGSYVEPGYTASDNFDGDVTANVTLSVFFQNDTELLQVNEIETEIAGSIYVVQYSVVDSAGNVASTVQRQVYIEPINECINESPSPYGPTPCPANSVCTDTFDSFSCACATMYFQDPTVDVNDLSCILVRSSCHALLDDFPALESGVYPLNLDGTEVAAQCDMETDGGGWLIVAKVLSGTSPTSGGYITQIEGDAHSDYHVIPQSFWPTDADEQLMFADSNAWRTAKLYGSGGETLQSMSVGQPAGALTHLSVGGTYGLNVFGTRVSMREKWVRYWPTSERQGLNCDVSDEGSSSMFELSGSNCAEISGQYGYIGIRKKSGVESLPTDCEDVHNVYGSSAAVTGFHVVALEETGSIQIPYNVYCDFDNDGGNWTVVARMTSGSTPTNTYVDDIVGDISDGLYSIPQRLWPAGDQQLFIGNSEWRTAQSVDSSEFRSFAVNSVHTMQIQRSQTTGLGQTYVVSSNFREKWFRYFPIAHRQGKNCDLTTEAASLFEANSADCDDITSQYGMIAIRRAPTAVSLLASCAEIKAANANAASGVYPVQIGSTYMNVKCDMDTALGGWTVVAAVLSGSSPSDPYIESIYGQPDENTFSIPQSLWPSGTEELFYSSSSNWRRATLPSELRSLPFPSGNQYTVSVERSTGQTYSASSNFRESWIRYFPIMEGQGKNCDCVPNDGSLFESSSADCGSLASQHGYVAIR